MDGDHKQRVKLKFNIAPWVKYYLSCVVRIRKTGTLLFHLHVLRWMLQNTRWQVFPLTKRSTEYLVSFSLILATRSRTNKIPSLRIQPIESKIFRPSSSTISGRINATQKPCTTKHEGQYSWGRETNACYFHRCVKRTRVRKWPISITDHTMFLNRQVPSISGYPTEDPERRKEQSLMWRDWKSSSHEMASWRILPDQNQKRKIRDLLYERSWLLYRPQSKIQILTLGF